MLLKNQKKTNIAMVVKKIIVNVYDGISNILGLKITLLERNSPKLI